MTDDDLPVEGTSFEIEPDRHRKDCWALAGSATGGYGEMRLVIRPVRLQDLRQLRAAIAAVLDQQQ